MVLLRKTATLGSASRFTYKPIASLPDAISAQKTALSSITPNSSTEAIAVKTQQSLLNNYHDIETQQAATATASRHSSLQAILPQTYNTASILLADRDAQIKALATPANSDKILNAIKYGVDMWRLQAHFCNISIMGQIAIGNPGCLTGPDLQPWIMQAPDILYTTGYLKTLISAVADAVANQFKQWQDFVTVPGLPWYPMFAVFSGPFAPPIPNIPMPLITCISQNQNKLMSAYQLETAIKSKLPAEFLLSEMDLFYFPLTVHIANYFTNWLCSQQVMMVMGMGPVPTYNPPYVPVGAVVNGYIIPSPGHLAA